MERRNYYFHQTPKAVKNEHFVQTTHALSLHPNIFYWIWIETNTIQQILRDCQGVEKIH